jgi:glycosyltransferase involved in cell wall biosynthesis
MTMHILFLTENFPPEGNAAASRVFERARYWVRWGHRVTIITTAPNFPSGKMYEGYKNRWHHVETIDGIRAVRVKTFIAANEGFFLRTLDFLSFMFTAVLAGLFQDRPDVIVATSPQFFTAIGGWLLGTLRRIPFVIELADIFSASVVAVGAMKPSPLVKIIEKLELFIYRKSAAIVALTEAFKSDLVSRNIDPGKISVIINGVDLPQFSPRPRNEEMAETFGTRDRFVVGYMGTLGMAHGLETVLDAAELMRDDDSVCFVFVGGGAAKAKLIEKAECRNLKNVIFIPTQPKARMPEAWSLCNVALIHLKNDPIFGTVIPSKIFEAMAMGLPLLAAIPKGEASKIIERETAGVIVPPGDPPALVEAVRRLRDDRPAHQVYSKCSLAAAPRYSRERQAEKMLEVLEGVAYGKTRRYHARASSKTDPTSHM